MGLLAEVRYGIWCSPPWLAHFGCDTAAFGCSKASGLNIAAFGHDTTAFGHNTDVFGQDTAVFGHDTAAFAMIQLHLVTAASSLLYFQFSTSKQSISHVTNIITKSYFRELIS